MTRTRRSTAVLWAAALSLAGPAAGQEGGPDAPRMKAIVHRSYGPPAEVLRLEELERPVPDDDQILLRVRAAAVNPLDVHFTTGKPFLEPGDAVFGRPAWSFARRRRWAWVALTVLTVNPLAWIVNAVYLRKRWREDVTAPAL